LGHFFSHRLFLSIGWKILQPVRQREREMTNDPHLVGTGSKQINFYLAFNYTPLLDSDNWQNKPLTLSSQPNSALDTRNIFDFLTKEEHLEKL
jgi:hypothetical protein